MINFIKNASIGLILVVFVAILAFEDKSTELNNITFECEHDADFDIIICHQSENMIKLNFEK